MAHQALTRESHVATSELITASNLAGQANAAMQEESKGITVGQETNNPGSNRASFK